MTTLRAVAYHPPGHGRHSFARVVLNHDERRVRRRLIALTSDTDVYVDFPAALTLEDDSALELDDGRHVAVAAGPEALYAIRGRDAAHLMALCWHIGNRHAKAQIEGSHEESGRILIPRDPVLRDMLVGLGASVSEITAPFVPLEGAYHSHGHDGEAHALVYRK